MVAKIAYESLHLKVKRNISTSNDDMSLLGWYLGGALLPTHLQVRNAESFFCILNTSTRINSTRIKSFVAWTTENLCLHCQQLPNL